MSREQHFSIREVSEKFGISHRTLRFYESTGLLQPKRTSPQGHGKNRHYGLDNIERVATILKLKSLGFRLSQIERMLAEPGDGPYGLSSSECEEQITVLNGQLARVQAAIDELERVYPTHSLAPLASATHQERRSE